MLRGCCSALSELVPGEPGGGGAVRGESRACGWGGGLVARPGVRVGAVCPQESGWRALCCPMLRWAAPGPQGDRLVTPLRASAPGPAAALPAVLLVPH